MLFHVTTFMAQVDSLKQDVFSLTVPHLHNLTHSEIGEVIGQMCDITNITNIIFLVLLLQPT